MATKRHIHARQLLLACLIILLLVTSGCKQQSTPRTRLSIEEVKSLSDEFERLSYANLQSWVSNDFDKMRQIYTEDAVVNDANVEGSKGVEEVISLAKMFTSYFPNYENRLAGTFIGRGEGFYIEELWGWIPNCLSTYTSSSDNPDRAFMWLTLNDEKIAYWWIFYGEEICSATMPFDSNLLRNYANVWSSGNPKSVAGLYTADAIRQDTLFIENQQGNTAINAYATKFFDWYPGVHLTLLESFGELPREIKRGGVYSIQVSDLSGKPCDVKMLVVLEPDETQAKIAQEWVFYNADSLIACGWAQ